MSSRDRPGDGVRVVAYDADWVQAFHREARVLQAALEGLAMEIEHIGSTVVTGMWAKPIIDILVGWRPPGDVERARRLLRPLNYDYVGEDGRRPGRFMFHKRAGPWCNLSIVPVAGQLWNDNLAVRDYLRAHPAAAHDYGKVKRQVAEGRPDTQAYQDAKRAFVDELREASRRWAEDIGPRPDI